MSDYINQLAKFGQPSTPAQTEGLNLQDLKNIQASKLSGDGNSSVPTQIEQDVRTLTPLQMTQKYGDNAQSILDQASQASSSNLRDLATQRTAGEAIADTGLGVAQGLGSTLGSLAAFGAGAFNSKAGTALSSGVDKLNSFINSKKSNALQAHQGVIASQDAMSARDSAAQNTDGSIINSLKQIGRDTIKSISHQISDPVAMSDGASQAVGSLLSAGPEAALIRSGLTKTAEMLGAATEGSGIAARLLRHGPGSLSIGSQEAAGTYQQTVSQIMGMNHDALMAGSDYYRDLIQNGMSPDDAKAQTANHAGLVAAGEQAPAAITAGSLVGKFEENPFAKTNIGGLATNIGKETLEEGLQSGGSQIAQNKAVKDYADRDQSLTDGIGQQIGQGALFGGLSAGIVGGPGSAIRGAADAGKLTMQGVTAVGNNIADRANKARQANEETSPISSDNITQAASEVAQNNPISSEPEALTPSDTVKTAIDQTDATPEQKNTSSKYVDDLMDSMSWNDDEVQNHEAILPEVKQAVSGSTNSVQAMHGMANLITDDKASTPARLQAMTFLNNKFSQIESLRNQDPSALTQIDPNSNAGKIVQGYNTLIGNVLRTPEMQKAFTNLTNLATKSQTDGSIKPVTEDNLQTEEGQQNAQNFIAASNLNPEGTDEKSAQIILQHAGKYGFQLNDQQKQALQSAIAILKGVQAGNDINKNTNQSPSDLVNQQVLSDGTQDSTGTGQLSAVQHARGIYAAMSAGNKPLAKSLFEDFSNFVQHQQNKVAAINENYAEGTGRSGQRSFSAYVGNGKFRPSKMKVGVTATDPKSVAFAQRVHAEAATLAAIQNHLSTAFRLGPQVKNVPLNSDLTSGSASDIARNIREGVSNPSEAKQNSDDRISKSEPESHKSTEDIQPEETKDEPKSTPEPEVASSKGIAAVYPNLIGSKGTGPKRNFFHEAFKLPEEARSNIAGMDDAIEVIREGLSSENAFHNLTGKSSKNKITSQISQAYREYLNEAAPIIGSMNDAVESFLNKTVKKSKIFKPNTTIKQGLLDGILVNQFANGKQLNLVEENNNKFTYNQSLAESAVLGGLHWLLNSNQLSRPIDEDNAASILGLKNEDDFINDVPSIPEETIRRLNTGDSMGENSYITMSKDEAVNALANTITRFWGLQKNPNAPIGFTDGIPMAMAGEVIESMINNKLIDLDDFHVDSDGNIVEKGGIRHIQRIVVKSDFSKSPMKEAPNLIAELIEKEPEQVRYMGDDMPPVPNTQMNNPLVNNTNQQKKALKNESQTEYYIHEPMSSLFTTLGSDNLRDLFGGGNIDGLALNTEHKASLEGKNVTVTASYQMMLDTISELKNRAEKAGIDPSELPVRYGYNMSMLGRMQMLGSYNPQSSKIMREVFLPTWSTLDLSGSNQNDYQKFMLGIAQGLGIKVHKKGVLKAVSDAEAELSGPRKAAIDALVKWHNSGRSKINDSDYQTIKNGMSDMTAVELMALQEYARYQTTKDKKSFKTPLYLEADGVTNGPINSMVLMARGAFDSSWVKNIARGGLLFGSDKQTLATQSAKDSNDLYQAATDAFVEARNNFKGLIKGNQPVINSWKSLYSLVNEFVPGVDFSNEQNPFDRKVAKNPLTITIYGSGANGIAGNILDTLKNEVYSRMSSALQNMQKGEKNPAKAFYPNLSTEEAEQKFNEFLNNFNALTTTKMVKTKEGYKVFKDYGSKTRNLDFEKFKITPQEFNNMQTHILHMFVNPLRDGIISVVGSNVFDGRDTVQKATQVMSIYLRHAFNKAVQSVIDERIKTDPEYKASDLLSKNDLDKIYKDLRSTVPLIHNSQQQFSVSGSERVQSSTDIARTLSDHLRMTAQINQPSLAGVGGIPTMVIGNGDGMMMQLAALNKSIKNTLKIFDGMNMPLDQIDNYSQMVNEAVHQSWQGNPIKMVQQSYDHFIKNAGDWIDELSEEDKATLARTTGEDLNEGLNQIGSDISSAAKEVDARIYAVNKIAHSVDQMAGAESPYIHDGEEAGSTSEEIADQLNKYFYEKLNTNTPKAEETVKETPIKTALESVGRKSGDVRIVSMTALKNLMKKDFFTADHKTIMHEILNSLATKEYSIMAGPVQAVSDYAQSRGKTILSAEDVQKNNTKGYINFGDKSIYLFNPSAETMVHELIHAATFEKILAHYEGNSTPEVSEAISNIEMLMNDFMSMDKDSISPSAQADMQNTRHAIQTSGIDAVGQAQALNEFMAWSLTNQNIASELKANVSTKTLAQKVVAAIKKLIWGRRSFRVKPSEDMYSNLQFNTAVIIRSQPTVSSMNQQLNLFQNNQYGTDDRLSSVMNTFDKQVASYIGSAKDIVNTQKRGTEAAKALINADQLAKLAQSSGFVMNGQESNAFRSIVSALATEAMIDPNVMIRSQNLFKHVMKSIKVEDFMTNPNSTDPNDRAFAQAKYDIITGAKGSRDSANRTSMLPVFLGLAITNNEFRNVLSKMPVPKGEKTENNSLDNILNNAGNFVLDQLTGHLAGDRKSLNIAEAIDALGNYLHDQSIENQSYIDQFASTSGGIIDRMNDLVVQGINDLSSKTNTWASAIEADTDTPAWKKSLAKMARISSNMATDEGADRNAEGVTHLLNKIDGLRPIKEMASDLMGTTSSQQPMMRLIKRIRSVIQQDRQIYREQRPMTIMKKFTRELSNDEWTHLFNAMGKTDLVSLMNGNSIEKTLNLLGSEKDRNSEIASLEKDLGDYITKSKELAHFMVTGETPINLLRNATAIAHLLGEKGQTNKVDPSLIRKIDHLVTLYAISEQPNEVRETINNLLSEQKEGMSFVASTLKGQREEEVMKTNNNPEALFNAYKGYIPSTQNEDASLLVLEDNQAAKYLERSYVRIGNYNSSNIETNAPSRGYYLSPVSAKAAYTQGAIQTIRQTSGGVDVATGFTQGLTAGRITDPAIVKSISRYIKSGVAGQNLMPVYDENGRVVALERSSDPAMEARLGRDTHLARMLGVWKGRQVEEAKTNQFNAATIDLLAQQYDPKRADEFVDMLHLPANADPILKDAAKMFTQDMREMANKAFGGDHMFVRKDQLNDAIGYRSATVGDLFTGNTRWNTKVQKVAQDVALAIGGNDAYKHLINAEKFIQNRVSDAKVLIVVKSIVVPMTNIAGNVLQLIARGVPMLHVARGMPSKMNEVNQYVKNRIRQTELEAELNAATRPDDKRRLQNQIQSIQDSHKRLSVWPLIEAGEFGSVSHAGLTQEDIKLTDGRWNNFIEAQVQKLPESIRTAGRYAVVTKDTALFQGLQKAVEYGDFVAKAVLYDDLTKRQKMPKDKALGIINEEFVNYDKLSGRFRQYLESTGLLWFYNFKMRSVKVAASMIRNNPVHTLLASLVPTPHFIGSIGTPVSDNFFSALADGKIDYSIGWGSAFRAPTLNPWMHIIH